MIGIAQTDPHKGCLITFQQPFFVYLWGKLKSKCPYINWWTDHFTINEKYQFRKWKNICWLISPEFFDKWLGYFSKLFSIYLAFLKMTWTEKSNFVLGSLHRWAIHFKRAKNYLMYNINTPCWLEAEIEATGVQLKLKTYIEWSIALMLSPPNPTFERQIKRLKMAIDYHLKSAL